MHMCTDASLYTDMPPSICTPSNDTASSVLVGSISSAHTYMCGHVHIADPGHPLRNVRPRSSLPPTSGFFAKTTLRATPLLARRPSPNPLRLTPPRWSALGFGGPCVTPPLCAAPPPQSSLGTSPCHTLLSRGGTSGSDLLCRPPTAAHSSPRCFTAEPLHRASSAPRAP